ncbi:AN1 zinc finger protein-like protein [Trichodelitschia bisporula]|uniref:AN1 zinc finger protein-like protein n=1 Tax=Trichodelitschia bisporula TaxID=703511 RepID=A0A6G1HIF4_9PEZI|nr:AN1 zinc finger protein-like protein [Trichodelitschia bisporula]
MLSNTSSTVRQTDDTVKGAGLEYGGRCAYSYCTLYTLLPLECLSCHDNFCEQHRLEDAHKCEHKGRWARERTGVNEQTFRTNSAIVRPHPSTCPVDSCRGKIDSSTVGVTCGACGIRFCFKHRHPDLHGCIPTSKAPRQAQLDKGLSALQKIRSWGLAKKTEASSAKTKFVMPSFSASERKNATALAEINKLKMAAKGDQSIPAEKRLYLHVQAARDTAKATYPSGKFFYNKEWAVGRVLDAAAKALQVQNMNNRVQSEDDRLRIYSTEAGRILEFSEKVGDVLINGNTITIMRGAGAGSGVPAA